MAEDIKSVDTLVSEAKKAYKKEFGHHATVAVMAPGRVNLIGDHVDYNDGLVMPMALPLVTVIVGGKSTKQDEITTVVTLNDDAEKPLKTTIEMPHRNAKHRVIKPGPPKWSNYIKGVIKYYIEDVYIPAFNAVIITSLPSRVGLSSSAALSASIYTFLDAITGANSSVTPGEKAVACQKAENQYNNVACGIMGQYIAFTGREGHAILIDCRNLTSTPIPMHDEQYVVLITDSHVKRDMVQAMYKTRKDQCQHAAMVLKKLSLRDATDEDLGYLISIKTDQVLLKRARHVITEIARTLEAAEALKNNDYQTFGRLMNESHRSLRDDYEVSCKEVDRLVEIVLEVDGVLGSKITGGGLGGCTVTLVKTEAVHTVIERIQNEYKATKPKFYICTPSHGARILENGTTV